MKLNNCWILFVNDIFFCFQRNIWEYQFILHQENKGYVKVKTLDTMGFCAISWKTEPKFTCPSVASLDD